MPSRIEVSVHDNDNFPPLESRCLEEEKISKDDQASRGMFRLEAKQQREKDLKDLRLRHGLNPSFKKEPCKKWRNHERCPFMKQPWKCRGLHSFAYTEKPPPKKTDVPNNSLIRFHPTQEIRHAGHTGQKAPLFKNQNQQNLVSREIADRRRHNNTQSNNPWFVVKARDDEIKNLKQQICSLKNMAESIRNENIELNKKIEKIEKRRKKQTRSRSDLSSSRSKSPYSRATPSISPSFSHHHLRSHRRNTHRRHSRRSHHHHHKHNPSRYRRRERSCSCCDF